MLSLICWYSWLLFFLLCDCRNESYQEDLWRKSFEYLKDHLSPETVEKYGPTQEPTTTEQVTEVEGEMTATDTAAVETGTAGETTTEQATEGQGVTATEQTPGEEDTTVKQTNDAREGETALTDRAVVDTGGEKDTTAEQMTGEEGGTTTAGTADGEDTTKVETAEKEGETTAADAAAVETGNTKEDKANN